MTTDPPDAPLALRRRAAARRLNVSERTLWEWTKLGLVPHLRVGAGKRQTVLYPVADLQQWLSERAAAAGGDHDPR